MIMQVHLHKSTLVWGFSYDDIHREHMMLIFLLGAISADKGSSRLSQIGWAWRKFKIIQAEQRGSTFNVVPIGSNSTLIKLNPSCHSFCFSINCGTLKERKSIV
jgi:hypothetical protein